MRWLNRRKKGCSRGIIRDTSLIKQTWGVIPLSYSSGVRKRGTLIFTMEKVNNLKQEEEWFMKNHKGKVICAKDYTSKEVESYPEAKVFFEKED